MDLRWRVVDLESARPFVISRGATTRFQAMIVELRHGEHVGYGEAAPSKAVTGETLESVDQFLQYVRKEVADLSPKVWEGFLDDLHANICGNPSARAAVDLALHDLVGKLEGVPARRLYGLKDATRLTTFTVSLGEPEAMAEEARSYEARGFRALKIKLGGRDGRDEERLAEVRGAVRATLRVDANEAWTQEEARRLLPALEAARVEMIEQPIPRTALRELAALQRETAIPLYADEAILDEHDVRRAIEAGLAAPGGVNLKLQKTGGLRPALQAARPAREHGLGVMAGCNLETSVGISAAAQMLDLLAYADLDGHLLLARDPFDGIPLQAGALSTPTGPGLGIRPSPG
ncbi:MAG TPA: dipeptide epimerase [Candidatus Thermoplasmatota archaeon]|nr:dipeptide epimerase [Candidatus Thermoplasmatota archaeon]